MSKRCDDITIGTGARNPAFTIIANASRIGDHLLEHLAAVP
jgi:hypothetical protein